MHFFNEHPDLLTIEPGRPDISGTDWSQRVETGLGLWVGGVRTGEGNWETLDPFEPGEVTYRGKLEDGEIAEPLGNRFDLASVDAVFEHINPIHYRECIANLWWMLKPGGLVRVEVPWIWAYHPGDQRYEFGGDFVRFTAEGLRRLFEECPGTSWSTEVCEFFIPEDAPFGIAVFGMFRASE